MEIQNFAEEYQSKTDDELLRLALDSEPLTPEAGAALNDEFARRRIDKNEQLQAFIQQEERRKEEQSE